MKKKLKKNNINQRSFYFEDYLETNRKSKVQKKTHNFQDRIFTLDNDKFVSALKKNPETSIGYQLKHNMFN